MNEAMIKEQIRRYIWQRYPGTLEALDLRCMMEVGMPCIDLLFQDAKKFVEVFRKIHGGREHAVRRALRELIIKPIVEGLISKELEDAFLTLLLTEPQEFAKKIRALPSEGRGGGN